MGLIVGQLKFPNGQALARATIHFVALKNSVTSVVRGVSASFETDSNGYYRQAIVDGEYRIRISCWPERGDPVKNDFIGDVVVDGNASINSLLDDDYEWQIEDLFLGGESGAMMAVYPDSLFKEFFDIVALYANGEEGAFMSVDPSSVFIEL